MKDKNDNNKIENKLKDGVTEVSDQQKNSEVKNFSDEKAMVEAVKFLKESGLSAEGSDHSTSPESTPKSSSKKEDRSR